MHLLVLLETRRAYTESPEWVDNKPDPEKKKITVNARLLDDFELKAMPVEVIDGKNLW